jgi:uncharacterized protein involved in oxidation of intracellular sulfur
MVGNKSQKILYIGTHAGEDPERACMPFALANAALAMGIKATVVLQGHGVYVAKKGYVDNMLPGGGFPAMRELLDSFLEMGGQLKICSPCIKERNIEETDLIKEAQTTGAGALNVEALEADAMLVY